ncbi:MAG: hypothetical protein FWE32_12260 [Oscillospiraceae bacterium]|nr:hypothetical protein [Oscillospiraceae bacterium]
MFGGDTKAERDKLIDEFEREVYDPFVTIRLRKVQIKALSEYIALLPFYEFRALALYQCRGYSYKRVSKTLGESRAKGLILYCKDRLTQCMNLPRPILEVYWRFACSKAMDIYPFPENIPMLLIALLAASPLTFF